MVKRKYISPYILLGLLLGSLIAACGGTSAGGTSTGGTSQAGISATATHAPAAPHGNPTAHVTAPFTATLTGGGCQKDDNGNITCLFEQGDLAFTLGPDTTGFHTDQVNNPTFHGSGTYSHITITVIDPTGSAPSVNDEGTVTVNADEQTGSFQVGNYTGTFDNGVPLSKL